MWLFFKCVLIVFLLTLTHSYIWTGNTKVSHKGLLWNCHRPRWRHEAVGGEVIVLKSPKSYIFVSSTNGVVFLFCFTYTPIHTKNISVFSLLCRGEGVLVTCCTLSLVCLVIVFVFFSKTQHYNFIVFVCVCVWFLVVAKIALRQFNVCVCYDDIL